MEGAIPGHGDGMIRFMRALLIAFAAVQLLLGLLLWLTPGFFYDEIGPFGARNDHYMADVATFYLALGTVAFMAVRRPVLARAGAHARAVQYTLHSLNHLIDIGESRSRLDRSGRLRLAHARRRAARMDAEAGGVA